MPTVTAAALPVGLLNGHLLEDEVLARIAVGATSVVAFSSVSEDNRELQPRWRALAPDVRLVDGGRVDGVREAIIECAKRQVLVLATGEPWSPKRFVAAALQGAAAATEFNVPGVAVHVVRGGSRPGPVAWLTDTGELSGYGVLFAVGYAQLHGCDVALIEPTSGLLPPRSPHAIVEARRVADALGIGVTTMTDPSPLDRVLRDEFCLVVHPVLDAPGDPALLRPDELSGKSIASGNPAAVVRLIEEFPGDVVAVFDGVRLVHGEVAGGRVAAAVTLGVLSIAGLGALDALDAGRTGGARGDTGVVLVDGLSAAGPPVTHSAIPGPSSVILGAVGESVLAAGVDLEGRGGPDELDDDGTA